ncbi:hypothetical protein ES705_40333 [subsurface metagenome]
MPKDERYYGSDLNKFIDDNCIKEMTCINIDCLLLRWSKKKLYIIESKHSSERAMKKGQRQLLDFLAKILRNIKICNIIEYIGWTFKIYIIIGDEPYDCLTVTDLIEDKLFEVTGKDNVIKFLEMEDEEVWNQSIFDLF